METINDVYSHAPGNLPPSPSPPSTRLREGRARNRGHVQRSSRLVATLASANRLTLSHHGLQPRRKRAGLFFSLICPDGHTERLRRAAARLKPNGCSPTRADLDQLTTPAGR